MSDPGNDERRPAGGGAQVGTTTISVTEPWLVCSACGTPQVWRWLPGGDHREHCAPGAFPGAIAGCDERIVQVLRLGPHPIICPGRPVLPKPIARIVLTWWSR
jgi:hypothetical protein